jgi:D-glycero-D-manno-heptose 1,7-bisphosphate phosphatase
MSGRPAAFLDRDGTIIVERHYLAESANVELLPGAAEGLRALADAGFALVVVTNQSGIARGLLTRAHFQAVQERLEALLARHGVTLEAVYYCPHHPDYDGPCDCRKPGVALFRQAARELGLDLRRSIFIGDRLRDVQPAFEFGGRAVLVRTGYGAELEETPSGVEVADDLDAAARHVVRDGAGPAGPAG